MKIEFDNVKVNAYGMYFPEEDILFCSWKADEKPHIERICLFDNETNAAPENKLYIELAQADDPNKALAFCNKYGPIHKRTSSLRTFYKTHIENSSRDFIPYSLFLYYQISINSLYTINLILNKGIFDDNNLQELYCQSIEYIFNSYILEYIMFQLPSEICCDYDEVTKLFSPYPLINFIYNKFIKDKDSSKFYTQLEAKTISPKIVFPLENLNTFFYNTLELYRNNQLQLPHDYLVNHKMDFITLAHYVFDQGLTFSLRTVQAQLHLNTSTNISLFEFDSLATAIFYHFFIEHSENYHFKVCANEYCKKLFLCSPSDKRKKYCSAECAHRVTNRKYKNRQKILPQNNTLQ